MMSVKIRFMSIICLMMISIGSFPLYLYSHLEFIKNPREIHTIHKKNIEVYLFPQNHPLHESFKHLFQNPHMFYSPIHFTNEGFKVVKGHRGLMVGFHPSIPQYLFKKFTSNLSEREQLQNYIKRIEGAEIIRQLIDKHHFQHIVVPHKWLYKLPSSFSKGHHNAYLLIVENMDIYGDWKNPNGELRKCYNNMDKEVLTELCILLHELGGCDAFPRNQPFTRSGKIAFIDTEHVGKFKGHFIKHIVPALNEELQAYALALWMKLEK